MAVRWSGDSPVRRSARPAGLTARSIAVRKRASNNYVLLRGGAIVPWSQPTTDLRQSSASAPAGARVRPGPAGH